MYSAPSKRCRMSPDFNDEAGIQARYETLVNTKIEYPQIPGNLYTSLVVTAANAAFLYEKSKEWNNVGFFYAALLLFDSADEILATWLNDPETWWEVGDVQAQGE